MFNTHYFGLHIFFILLVTVKTGIYLSIISWSVLKPVTHLAAEWCQQAQKQLTSFFSTPTSKEVANKMDTLDFNEDKKKGFSNTWVALFILDEWKSLIKIYWVEPQSLHF